MTPKRWALAVCILLILVAASFGAGRYSKPAKVEVRTEFKDRIVVQTKTITVEAKDVHRVKTVKRLPSGEVDITQTTDLHTKSKGDTESKSDTKGETKTAAVTKNDAPRATVSLLVGVHGLDVTRPVFGGQAQYRVAGPLVLGAFGYQDGFWGLSAGISF